MEAPSHRTNEVRAASLHDAFAELQKSGVESALAIFSDIFHDAIDLPEDRVASVMIEVAAALIAAFEHDSQSPAAYDFFRNVNRQAAEIIAGLLELANFPTGSEDPTTIREPIILAYAGALSAAGRHNEATGILARLLVKRPNHLPLSHAMFVAQRREAGLSDDLRGRFCAVPFEGFDAAGRSRAFVLRGLYADERGQRV